MTKPTATIVPTTTAPTVPAALCPGEPGSASPFLARSIISPPVRFAALPSSQPQELSIDEVADLDQLATDNSSSEYANLQDDDFIEAERYAYDDGTDGLQADIRVFQFACPAAATQYIASVTASSTGIQSPVDIATGPASTAVGWASAGPDQLDQFTDVVAQSVGSYVAEVFLNSATPTNGAYAVTVLDSEAEFLGRLTSGASSTSPSTPAPGSLVAIA